MLLESLNIPLTQIETDKDTAVQLQSAWLLLPTWNTWFHKLRYIHTVVWSCLRTLEWLDAGT